MSEVTTRMNLSMLVAVVVGGVAAAGTSPTRLCHLPHHQLVSLHRQRARRNSYGCSEVATPCSLPPTDHNETGVMDGQIEGLSIPLSGETGKKTGVLDSVTYGFGADSSDRAADSFDAV